MSKSAEIHKQTFPYCHPFASELPPSKAARFIADNWHKRERSQRTIVDAGCGEGQDTVFLLSEGFHVIAIDASEHNLGILSQKITEARIPPSGEVKPGVIRSSSQAIATTRSLTVGCCFVSN